MSASHNRLSDAEEYLNRYALQPLPMNQLSATGSSAPATQHGLRQRNDVYRAWAEASAPSRPSIASENNPFPDLLSDDHQAHTVAIPPHAPEGSTANPQHLSHGSQPHTQSYWNQTQLLTEFDSSTWPVSDPSQAEHPAPTSAQQTLEEASDTSPRYPSLLPRPPGGSKAGAGEAPSSQQNSAFAATESSKRRDARAIRERFAKLPQSLMSKLQEIGSDLSKWPLKQSMVMTLKDKRAIFNDPKDEKSWYDVIDTKNIDLTMRGTQEAILKCRFPGERPVYRYTATQDGHQKPSDISSIPVGELARMSVTEAARQSAFSCENELSPENMIKGSKLLLYQYVTEEDYDLYHQKLATEFSSGERKALCAECGDYYRQRRLDTPSYRSRKNNGANKDRSSTSARKKNSGRVKKKGKK